MNIPIVQLPGLFTTGVQDTYTDRLMPKNAFYNMASVRESNTLGLRFNIRRSNEKVAVEVERGTEGNRNAITRQTVKEYIPPFFNEYVDLTTLENYNRVFSADTVSETSVGDLVEETLEEASMVIDKINRAYEVQWKNVLETGIVTLINGDNIDYKRKAASIVDVNTTGGGYWNTAGATIKDDLTKGCEFLRTTGKSQSGVVNAYMGSTAFNEFLSATETLTEGDTRYIKRMDIRMPSMTPNGMVFQGQYAAGSWVVNIFTYPDYYDVSGVSTPYMPTNKVFLVPSEGFNFVHGFGATPTVFEAGNSFEPLGSRAIAQRRGQFNMSTVLDENKFTHKLRIMSAGLAIPVSVDQMYTLTVLA